VKILRHVYEHLAEDPGLESDRWDYSKELDIFGDKPLVRAIRDDFKESFPIILASPLSGPHYLDWRYLLRVANGVSDETLDALAWCIHDTKFQHLSQRHFLSLVKEKEIAVLSEVMIPHNVFDL
jgi:hypothetical protein